MWYCCSWTKNGSLCQCKCTLYAAPTNKPIWEIGLLVRVRTLESLLFLFFRSIWRSCNLAKCLCSRSAVCLKLRPGEAMPARSYCQMRIQSDFINHRPAFSCSVNPLWSGRWQPFHREAAVAGSIQPGSSILLSEVSNPGASHTGEGTVGATPTSTLQDRNILDNIKDFIAGRQV